MCQVFGRILKTNGDINDNNTILNQLYTAYNKKHLLCIVNKANKT